MAYAYDMIQETIPYVCRRCGSPDIVKNGTNKCGRPQYYCHACGAHRTLTPKRPHAAQFKSLILKTYHERASLHGLERIFHVSRQTVAHWLRTILRTVPKFQQTVLPAQPGDVLELDEVWSFVLKKARNGGYGSPCVGGHAKWSRLQLATAARRPVADSGTNCRRITSSVSHIAISGWQPFWDRRSVAPARRTRFALAGCLY